MSISSASSGVTQPTLAVTTNAVPRINVQDPPKVQIQDVPKVQLAETNKSSAQDSAQLDPQKLEQAITRANQFVQSVNPSIQFVLNQDLNKYVVQVVDDKTKDVIRQIPSQEMIDIARGLDRFQGVLVKEQA